MGDEPQPPSLIAGRRLRLLRVYVVVARVLLSYAGFRLVGRLRGAEWREQHLPRWDRRNAARIRHLILDVQGLFIKIGQLLSVLASFLPPEFRDELEALQDQIPARPFSEIESRLRSQLGEPADLFAELDPVPIAAASLAQVHAARLPDGRRVAVKVRHRDIERLAHLDLSTVRRVLGAVQWVLGIRGLTGVFQEVRAMIAEELDFSLEAKNLTAVARALAEQPGVACPELVPELSTPSVLTTSFVEGVKVSDLDELRRRGFDPEEIASRLLHAYCKSLFAGEPYHADPHPGNLLVDAEGEVVLVDFGAVSRVSERLRSGIPSFLESALKRDTEGILRALTQMGFVNRQHRESDEIAERVIEYFYRRIFAEIDPESWNLGDLQLDLDTKVEVMADLSRLDLTIRDFTSTFQLPRDWILLQRTILLLLGLCTHLAPELQPMKVVRPHLEEMVIGKGRDWTRFVVAALKDMALTTLALPEDLRRTIRRAERGELEVRIHGFSTAVDLLYALGQQLVFAGLGFGTGALGYLARSQGDEAVALPLFGISGGFALLFLGTLIRGRQQSRRLRRRF